MTDSLAKRLVNADWTEMYVAKRVWTRIPWWCWLGTGQRQIGRCGATREEACRKAIDAWERRKV